MTALKMVVESWGRELLGGWDRETGGEDQQEAKTFINMYD
jgi:hypothetical protein